MSNLTLVILYNETKNQYPERCGEPSPNCGSFTSTRD
nr:MAG TPA: hypothetical protein [Caudoviricetes sp.]